MQKLPWFFSLVIYSFIVIPQTHLLDASEGEVKKHSVMPEQGMVPDEKTAIQIAKAVWGPIYGEEEIEKEKPFQATLAGDIWTVEGSLPEGWVGGVAVAEISKKDGRILRVSHGK